MDTSFKKIIASVTLAVMFFSILPTKASARTEPSARTIFKQSFEKLDAASSYDMNGRVGIVLPASLVKNIPQTEALSSFLVNGNELRSYFTGSFNKAAEDYQIVATSYNAKTGESPRLEFIGNEEGVLNVRFGGFVFPTSTDPEKNLIASYLNTWIRIDRATLPASFVNPLFLPVVGVNSSATFNSSDATILSRSEPSAVEAKKLKEMDLKIRAAFWNRTVITARRLADAKDYTGAPAYHLGLKLDSVGTRLFILDVSKIVGKKLSTSDSKEISKLFTKLPNFSGDLIVNKKSMLPELLTLSASGFEKNKQDDVTVSFRISFEHVGSGRQVVMPTEYKRFEDILSEVNKLRPSVSVVASSTNTVFLAASTSYAECSVRGTCPLVPDPTYNVVYRTTSTTALTEAQARNLALSQGICARQGSLKNTPGFYNSSSKVWWFDMESTNTPLCLPSCEVSEITLLSQVNGRCTGAR